MTPMEIELRTLTPLWTGGVDQVCDRVHETGLIGSLRWWYEALVRGLGSYACDPTAEPKCSFGEEKYRKSRATDERQRLREAGLCDVCQAFGATGWARKFRLQVVGGKGEIIEDALTKANTDFVLLDLIGQPNEEIAKQAKADLQIIAEAIGAMMLTYGFSAKRTSGYGTARAEITGVVKTQADEKLATRLSQLTQEVWDVRF